MNRIKSARLKAGLSQKEVALSLGVKGPSVHAWETGKTQPTAANLKTLAHLYKVPVDYLLGEDENPELEKTKSPITDDDIKFALFGGTEGITDADYEDVKRYAAFIASKRNQ